MNTNFLSLEALNLKQWGHNEVTGNGLLFYFSKNFTYIFISKLSIIIFPKMYRKHEYKMYLKNIFLVFILL